MLTVKWKPKVKFRKTVKWKLKVKFRKTRMFYEGSILLRVFSRHYCISSMLSLFGNFRRWAILFPILPLLKEKYFFFGLQKILMFIGGVYKAIFENTTVTFKFVLLSLIVLAYSNWLTWFLSFYGSS